MKRINLTMIWSILSILGITLQAQSLKYQGFPSREGKIDLRSNFLNPPKGYGNVPFYWWNGDTLKYERLLDQLLVLADASTDGLSVSYIHTHPGVDVELNQNGYGSFGRADAGVPGFYSEDWWNLWNQFSAECARQQIGLGVDDYVVGWAGNGFYVDEVLHSKDFVEYQGRLHCQNFAVGKGQNLDVEVPEHVLSIMAYPGGKDLMPYVQNGRLKWTDTCGGNYKVYVVSTTASPELHPEYGKRLVEVYFNRFEEKLDEQGEKGIDYFFQDELRYDLNIHSWCEDMCEEFQNRKGYDIRPYLPALWEYIGGVTPKIRLDYAQVVIELAEERYFKPVFDWHNERGLIYGCDNNGRGLEPLQYLDYFRAISWFTAPGNDAPARGSSFRQTKVSSSVTHLYQRPRTWLEAFHSMGWDSNGEWLRSQLDLHMIAGGNLLCLHGLYYSTHGGWWEWAPPCFHFRMPYWPHMKRWLKYAERMSFVLSQGTHVCDVAVMYPTEAMQAYPDMDISRLWNVADKLTASGLDYDFIDYKSLQNAKVDGGILQVAGEKYKVLILVDMKAMHYETLLKIYDFYKRGGIVMAVGEKPLATSRIGEDDAEVNAMLDEIFSGAGIQVVDVETVPQIIHSKITPDFYTEKEEGMVLHRQVGNQDVYMVMNVSEGDKMFFRSKGKVECWDAWNGKITDVPILKQTKEGTWIQYTGTCRESRLFVFSPGEPVLNKTEQADYKLVEDIKLDGEWNIKIIPTMNNKWGDFRLPASDEWISPEAREFFYEFITENESDENRMDRTLDACGVYGFAPYMEMLTLPATVDWKDCLSDCLMRNDWTPYCYSWQYGVFDNPGSQGYHGLKGKVDNRFLILDQGGHQLFRTYIYAPSENTYRLEQEGVVPDGIYLDAVPLQEKQVKMQKGWHQLLLVYANTSKAHYILTENKSNCVDNRERSAVVFYPADVLPVKENNPYGAIVAMKWYGTEHLVYSPFKDAKGTWIYRFQTAPGTRSMTLRLNGTITEIWADGKLLEEKQVVRTGENEWLIDLKDCYVSGVSSITMTALPALNGIGPALFVEPVKMCCKEGKMPLGNWTDCGALKFYSGGIRYMKQVTLSAEQMSDKMLLDLGGVNATCEVSVNGQKVEVLMNAPYQLEIGQWLKEGNNNIEVLVYSTLSNHYQTIPSAYRGLPVSGLLGPVNLLVYRII